MSSRWFRAYAETLNDPKVQTLPDASFKAWHNAMYMACQIDSTDGNIGTLEEIAYALRETEERVSSLFQPIIQKGLIETTGETFRIKAWKKRQYKSDSSTERVKKHREKVKRSSNGERNGPRYRKIYPPKSPQGGTGGNEFLKTRVDPSEIDNESWDKLVASFKAFRTTDAKSDPPPRVWSHQLGKPPDHPACQAPREILRKYGYGETLQ